MDRSVSRCFNLHLALFFFFPPLKPAKQSKASNGSIIDQQQTRISSTLLDYRISSPPA
ncbi:uncharacterized protein ARB_06901 [Trichophyton benhamiae CBS 112371]|uniref:Uncharacterized protein n=1 Tax=Arthroderma benhamiae (strain ATCC MYA-4681 / CBS 112371) TaxID=663331 RepID=D4AR71_ARTBC|nr:uncharacterized protein ARB_06901 [Trichophyton benhamiae CBS 112371]EFE34500.1 hypothetical protein ARB_06901 [Trichophyton benhamiae CBS 112371]